MTSMTSTPSGPEIGSQPRSGHERAVATYLQAFRSNPLVFHASLLTPDRWNQFVRFCRDATTFDRATRRRGVGAALRLIAGAGRPERRGA